MRSSDQSLEWPEDRAFSPAETSSLAGEAILSHPHAASGVLGRSANHQPLGRVVWFDFVRLIFSTFLFIEPIQRKSVQYWVQFGCVYLCFLVLYFTLILSRSKRTGFAVLILIGLLGVAYFPQNFGALSLFIYIASFTPFYAESLQVCTFIFAAECVALTVEGILLHLNTWLWAFGSFLTLAVGCGNLVVAQRMRSDYKLLMAHEQIEQLAKMSERDRIARDLHDVLGHTLSVIVLKSELAGKLMSSNLEKSRKEMAEIEEISRAVLKDVREAICGYRSQGLTAEIARATLDAAGVLLDCEAPPKSMHPSEEVVLSLVLRETVTNIVRHSEAKKCRMEFNKSDVGTLFIVHDDGRGKILQEGNGLRGMRERVKSVGGTLNILSDHGTRLEIRIPEKA